MYINKSGEGRRSQAERRAETRGALLGAAGGLFAAGGDSGGSTRGALYHHFDGKRGLFRALIEELENELEAVVMGAAREHLAGGGDLWKAYAAGFDAFLDECARPEVGRVLFVDGPSVLGWKEWHEIDARYALAQTEAGLRALVEAGLLGDQPVEPLARLLHGASVEAALYVASSEDPGKAKEEVRDAMGRLLGALRWVPGRDRT